VNPWLLLAVVAAGIAGGFANVVAGGGSFVTVPALILTGVPVGVANGTSRLGIVLQNIVAVLRFRSAGVLPSKLLVLIVPTCLGAVLGAGLALWVPDEGFRRIFAGIMLIWAAAVALRPEAKPTTKVRTLPPWLVTFLLFAIGIYGGFAQAAAGYMFLALFTMGMGMPLKEANILKVVLICAYMPIAFLVFILGGKVDWLLGALLSLGQIGGAWVGAGVVMGGKAGIVRAVLLVAVILGALQLLGVF
jgi:uncharacterized protein